MGALHEEFAKSVGLPFLATIGGKESLYPEFMKTIKALQAERPR